MVTLVVVVLVAIVLAACAVLGIALWGQSINRAQAKAENGEQAEIESQGAIQLDPVSPALVPDPVITRAQEPILTTPQEPAKPRPQGRNQVAIDYDRIASFPGIATKQVRCVGMMHYLSDNQRRRLNPPFVIAVPEPSNSHDSNAVIIVSAEGRRYGYLSAGQAKSYSALIQEIGALQLDCRTEGIKLWLDLPTVPELRKAVRALRDASKA